MGIADRFAGNGAQAETLFGVEAAALEPAIVEGQRFRLRMLDEQFAVIGAGQGLGDVFAHRRFIGIEKRQEIGGHGMV